MGNFPKSVFARFFDDALSKRELARNAWHINVQQDMVRFMESLFASHRCLWWCRNRFIENLSLVTGHRWTDFIRLQPVKLSVDT